MAHVTSPEPVRPAAPVNQTPGSPFVELDRATWARLSNELEQPFDEADLARLLALGDRLDLDEVRRHILDLPHVQAVHDLHASQIATGLPVLSAHVIVDDECFTDGHAARLLTDLQDCVATHFPVSIEHSTFQIEPAGHRTTEHTLHP